MKKLLVILVCSMLVLLTSCVRADSDNQKIYNLGEEVKTDTLKVKLLSASYKTLVKNGEKELTAEENHTFAEFTFYVENLGKSEIKFAGPSQARFNSVKYENNEYESNAVFLARSLDNLSWEEYSLDYITLLGKSNGYFKAYIDIPVRVDDLTSKVVLNFFLPEGKAKYQKFTYST